MITAPLIEATDPGLRLIPVTHFYAPYSVLWCIVLASFIAGIVLGYRRADIWRRLHIRIVDLVCQI